MGRNSGKKAFVHYLIGFCSLSQNRRQQTGDGFFGFDHTGAVQIHHIGQFGRKLHIPVKEFCKFCGYFFIINKGVHFKIQFKASDINVGSTDGGCLIVRNNHLGVQKAVVVDEDAGSSSQHLASI